MARAAATEQGQRGSGRKPAGKRGAFKFRVSDDLRENLTAAAQAKGRPVSEEIELRLEHSLRDDQFLGGAHNVTVGRLIAAALATLDAIYGGTWHATDMGKIAARRVITSILNAIFGNAAPGLLASSSVVAAYNEAADVGRAVADQTMAEHNRELARRERISAAERLREIADRLEADDFPDPPPLPQTEPSSDDTD